jgi:hypothetical protein
VNEDDHHALLMEIDENLARANLSPAERALHVGRRKAIYEGLHPRCRSRHLTTKRYIRRRNPAAHRRPSDGPQQ